MIERIYSMSVNRLTINGTYIFPFIYTFYLFIYHLYILFLKNIKGIKIAFKLIVLYNKQELFSNNFRYFNLVQQDWNTYSCSRTTVGISILVTSMTLPIFPLKALFFFFSTDRLMFCTCVASLTYWHILHFFSNID